MATLAAVQHENKRLQEEIQKLMLHNTKLQREMMTLNVTREQTIAQGHERIAALTAELKQVDSELETVRGDCDRILSVVCTQKDNNLMRSLEDVVIESDPVDDDFQSDHSTASTASTSSFRSSRSYSRNDSRAKHGKPPLSKKLSIDIGIDEDEERRFSKSSYPVRCSVSAAAPPSGATRECIMSRISRSVKKAQSVPQLSPGRPSVRGSIACQSPMLAYKAHSVIRASQTHLNNFRRHSGPHRRNRDTVVL